MLLLPAHVGARRTRTVCSKSMLATPLVGFRFYQGSPAGACSDIYCCHFNDSVCRRAEACCLNVKAEQMVVFLKGAGSINSFGTVLVPVEQHNLMPL
jgi:hypothetical protein